MKIRNVVVGCALVLGTFAATRAVYSQDEKKEGGGMPSEAEMKAMEEAAAPTEEHTKLARWVGSWTSAGTCDAMPGMTSTGTVKTESLLGGRAFLSNVKGEMGGHPFEGVELKGYDKEKKEHWSVWSDSTGTCAVFMRGQREGDAITYTAEPYLWMGQKWSMTVVVKYPEGGHPTMDMTMQPEGGAAMKMAMTYTPQK